MNRIEEKHIEILFCQNEYAGLSSIYLNAMGVNSNVLDYKVSFRYKDYGDDVVLLARAMTVFNTWYIDDIIKLNDFKIVNDTRKHNLSVNDIVSINGLYYRCKPFGWDVVSRIKISNDL